jgi:hypothetical protein
MSVKISEAVSLLPNADSDLLVVSEIARALINGNANAAIEKRFEKRIVTFHLDLTNRKPKYVRS